MSKQKITIALLLLAAGYLAAGFINKDPQVHIYMAGDSTMSDKAKSARPEMGWGTRMNDFFDSTVVIVNKAQNGRSTKTFIQDGLWRYISENATRGDYVLIQFGHNDEVPSKSSYTSEDEFRENLEMMVFSVRKKEAIPVLITPVARRKFDSLGKTVDTHVQYAAVMRLVANKHKVTLIDLGKESQLLLEKFGVEDSRYLFNHLLPGQNPNYPEGKIDDTHLNELGARKMAQIVLKDLRKIFPDLNKRVVKSNWGK
ncbi:rhamnogalacturonan acetylesterase [Pedobacter sp.]|uniref:rhamnogalacturonan acetylesterase n=1 Tax=Pedobacter sp. TaxID=1411316 RepID=UPI003BACEE4A